MSVLDDDVEFVECLWSIYSNETFSILKPRLLRLKRRSYKRTQFGKEFTVYAFELYFEEKKIGNMEFAIHKEDDETYIMLRDLQNMSIKGGKRKFDGIGTALINCLKKVAKHIQIDIVHVTAQVPFNTPLPEPCNLVDFYTKNGFIVRNVPCSYGHRMMCSLKGE